MMIVVIVVTVVVKKRLPFFSSPLSRLAEKWTCATDGATIWAMSEARNVYRLLGLELENPISIVGLCVEAIGRKPEWRQQQKESTLELLEDGHHIYVSTRLKPARARWRIGHELAHWYFEKINHSSERIEQECDSLGAELCVPRAMVLDAWSRFGTDLRAAAEWLQTTQSLVLLRYGECVVPGVSGTAVLESSKIIARSASHDYGCHR